MHAMLYAILFIVGMYVRNMFVPTTVPQMHGHPLFQREHQAMILIRNEGVVYSFHPFSFIPCLATTTRHPLPFVLSH